jgi:hypothetical protein
LAVYVAGEVMTLSSRIAGVVLQIVLAGCDQSGTSGVAVKDLVFLTRDGCVNTTLMRSNLDQALDSMRLPKAYHLVDLGTLAQTDPRIGYPTPTLLYREQDVFGMVPPAPPYPEPT